MDKKLELRILAQKCAIKSDAVDGEIIPEKVLLWALDKVAEQNGFCGFGGLPVLEKNDNNTIEQKAKRFDVISNFVGNLMPKPSL